MSSQRVVFREVMSDDAVSVASHSVARVQVPGSKSIANRALICAALADGTSVISNVPDGDDTTAMLNACELLGLEVHHGVNNHGGNKEVRITGHFDPAAEVTVNARLAGTTSRFLLALSALSTKKVTVTGDGPLLTRPVGELARALRALGFRVEPESSESLPLTVYRASDNSTVKNNVTIRGDVSSQFISALMLIGPALPQGLSISIDGVLVSRSYVEMTAHVMRLFGANVDVSARSIDIEPKRYVATHLVVEPDFSSAAFPIVGAALSGQTVRLPGLATARTQGDARILEIVQQMGVAVSVDGDDVIVHGDKDLSLQPFVGDLSDCSDLVPAVAVLCVFAVGVSELHGIGFIRAKESDRIGDLAAELVKVGADVQVLDDGLRITGVTRIHGSTLDTHHDHRLAMALSLLGLRTEGLRVNDESVVSKSWPTYWGDMSEILHTELSLEIDGEDGNDHTEPSEVVAAFDLDHTLTIRDCVGPFMVAVTGRWKIAVLIARLCPKLFTAAFRKDRDGVKKILVMAVFAQKREEEIQELGEQFAEKVLSSWMRSDVAQRLRWHQSQSHRVILVTASLSPYVIPMAKRMDIDDVLCTELSIVNGRYTGEIAGNNCRGLEKVHRLNQWAGNGNAQLGDADQWLTYAYGDSHGDVPMLTMAQRGTRVGRKDLQPAPGSHEGE